MLQLQVSGPVYCGVSRGAIGDVYLCPDDCNDTTLDPRVDWIHGVRGPGAGTCGLEWVRRTLRWSREHAAGRLPGVMLGDELSGGMSRGNYSAVADAIHEVLDGTEHFVYTNEGTHSYGPAGWEAIPPGIDVVSLDGYGVCEPADAKMGFCIDTNQSEAVWHRAFYQKFLYHKLLPHQRVAVVPGLFGCATPDQTGGCERNASLIETRCLCSINGEDLSPAGQDAHLLRKLSSYYAWFEEDPMLVGINPWHWNDRTSSLGARRAFERHAVAFGPSAPPVYRNPSLDLGANGYPRLVAQLERLGWNNVSNMLPPSRCGRP